jgi:hypothetical protein
MSQATLGRYPTGGSSNADRRQYDGHQAPLSDATADGATVEVPETVGAYERVAARHGGEVVAWSDGTDTVSVVQLIGDGGFEVTGADESVPNPGRIVVEAETRSEAIDEAAAHMRAESTTEAVQTL